jgi:hypothetical protein
MHQNKKILLGILVVVILGILIYSCKKDENYKSCICSQARNEECKDVELGQQLYQDGIATEYTKFKDKGWDTVNSGDVNYPVLTGCSSGKKEDRSPKNCFWDFEDLAD